MAPKISPQHLEKKLNKLFSIVEISVQLEEVRKFLSHFIDLLKDGVQYEDYYFSILMLCVQVISRCDVTDRDIGVLSKILNTVLEIIHRDYVSTKVVVESLAMIHDTMRQLFHLEAKQLHGMLRMKLSNISKYFNEMNNFSIMWSIVGILYEYVCKYEHDERERVLLDILSEFYDSTGKLIEILLWPRASFNSQCRKFLNNIPGRKYFCLAARCAIFAGRKIVPRKDYDYIAFEWNMNPMELSFKKFCFEGERDTESEVSVDLLDITTVQIMRAANNPRVICEFEKITTVGISVNSYQLKIDVSDDSELSELQHILNPFINPPSVKRLDVAPSPKLPNIEPSCEEVVIRHEKLYNTMDFTNHTLTNDNSVTKGTMQRDSTPKQSLQSMAHDENHKGIESEDTNFKPFDMQWKANLLKSTTKPKRLIYDPYDIAHMREEEKEQRKEKALQGCPLKRAKDKISAYVPNGKRPKIMQCSTPIKNSTPTGTHLQSRPIEEDELSSIGHDSNDDPVTSDGSDATFVPYKRLSKTPPRGRGNQKGRKRRTGASTRVPPKRTNVKKNEPKKSGRGTRKGTTSKGEKEQKWDVFSGAPAAPTTTQTDEAANDSSCHAMDTTLSKPQNRRQINAPKSNFLCDRLNAKKTTTQTTTKVTTTKTTEVGIGACTTAGNRPTTETATLEDVDMMPPNETVPVHATQKVYTSLYKIEKHQEYRVQREVNELDCCCAQSTISTTERAHVLAHLDKIKEILSRNWNNAETH